MFRQNFVASHQQVGDFKAVKVRGRVQKNGGNVAGYFCTPQGRVIHATAGPVSADALLDAAHFALDLFDQLQEHDLHTWDQIAARAHQQQASDMGVPVPRQMHPAPHADWNAAWKNRALSNEQRVHMLLAERPLAPLSNVYREVFKGILGEDISYDSPNLVLAERGLAIAKRTHRPMLFVLHDSSHHSAGYDQWLAVAARYRAMDDSFLPLVSQFVVVVLPLDEMPALSRRLKQPPFNAPDTARPLLVVARGNGQQIAAFTGLRPDERLTHNLASALVDAVQRHPPTSAELRSLTRVVDLVDRRLAEPLREISRQRRATVSR